MTKQSPLLTPVQLSIGILSLIATIVAVVLFWNTQPEAYLSTFSSKENAFMVSAYASWSAIASWVCCGLWVIFLLSITIPTTKSKE